jgi:hypothetical protein
MESFRQALGAVYFALAEAAGGDDVLDRASDILADAVAFGAIDDPYARAAVMALVRSSTTDEPAAGPMERRLPSNLAAPFPDAQYNHWLLDIAENLGPRPGARAAHQKLKEYADTNYPRDRNRGTVPTGENGTLFLMLESRGGDFPSEDRILKGLSASREVPTKAVA